jgi:hypothetical protein
MLESKVWLDRVGRSLAIGVAAIALSSCAALEAQRAAEERKASCTVPPVPSVSHFYVTPDDPPSNKPYSTLGDLTYTEPFTFDATNEARIKDKLKQMGYARWPQNLDALVKEKSVVSDDGSMLKVSAEAIQFESSTNCEKLHHVNNGPGRLSNTTVQPL